MLLPLWTSWAELYPDPSIAAGIRRASMPFTDVKVTGLSYFERVNLRFTISAEAQTESPHEHKQAYKNCALYISNQAHGSVTTSYNHPNGYHNYALFSGCIRSKILLHDITKITFLRHDYIMLIYSSCHPVMEIYILQSCRHLSIEQSWTIIIRRLFTHICTSRLKLQC